MSRWQVGGPNRAKLRIRMLRGAVSLLAIGSLFLAWHNFKGWQDGRPCFKPIAYSIGSFDERFDISLNNFLLALSEAERVWENSLTGEEWNGRNTELFIYSPEKTKLAVNLIYDYRQEVTEELSVIERVVKTGEASYDNLESRYNSLKSEYNFRKRAYDQVAESFKLKSEAYERSVERWNAGSRTSKQEFEALENERLAIEAELRNLKSLERNLNDLVKEINSAVERLNTLARELNLNVEEYNSVGASRGETFAGGTYTSDGRGERIDIFEFENKDKLVRVLAHEFGHALGLEHLDDPKAIMYHLNEDTAGKTSASDVAALKLLCGVE